MTTEKTISQNLALIEYYKEQLNQLEIQLQISQTAINDYTKAKITLEHLAKTDKNQDILIPLGGGTFIDGILQDYNKILTDVGAGVILEKTIGDALIKLNERIKTMEETRDKLVALVQKIQSEAYELSQKTQELMQENQQQ